MSVMHQTYQGPLECILVDDCGTDNSLEIIEKYKNNPHLSQIVVNETNSGSTFKQWDKGIGLANGELIWIAESDDYCELNLLEELIAAYTSRKNVVIAYAPIVYTDEDGKKTGIYSRTGRTQYIKSRSFVCKYLALDNVIHNASCAVFSKKAALSIDKRYKGFVGVGDWWFWTLIAETGNIRIVNKHLSYFRRHEGSVTLLRTISGENAIGFKELVDYIFNKYGLPQWRLDYIRYSSRWLYDTEYVSEEIKKKVYTLWSLDKQYSFFELFAFRVMRYFRRKKLIYL